MVSLEKRLERLEARSGKSWAPDTRTVEALGDYFAVLGGREVPERSDPELEAYFAELEQHERERKEHNNGQE
jgi:hypothetical protein